jgi:hypothetical protein
MDIGDAKPGTLHGHIIIPTPFNVKTGEISMDSTYDPTILPDYDQDVFKFKKAQLVQQPLYDLDGDLVPPDRAPFLFRNGALVAVEAQLMIHSFLENKSPNHVRQPSSSVSSPITYTLPSSIKLLPPVSSSLIRPHYLMNVSDVPS